MTMIGKRPADVETKEDRRVEPPAGLGNSCGVLAPTDRATPVNGKLPCWPLPDTLKVATNVLPGAGGTFKFSLNYASKLSGTGTGGGDFNVYPSNPATTGNPNSQAWGDDALGTPGNGLPFTVVATQVGKG